ncbi:MAG: hypothetical protein JJD92_11240 [Frankiaceae bacterium]|nr:hypothetical protein [Frankiaceae bacterium]
MSQDTFPFADGDEGAHVEDGAQNRKAIMVAGGVAAALVVVAGGWFLLGGGDEAEDAFFVPRAKPAAAAPAAKAPAVKVAKKLPVAYKEPLGRDPFRALYVVPAAPVAAAPVAAAAPTTTTSGTGTNGTFGATTPTSTRYTLKLVSISKPSPEVRFSTWMVGADKKTVIPAQRFGKYGELVVLAFSKNASGVVDRAVIQVGDDSPMDVAIGESVSVL